MESKVDEITASYESEKAFQLEYIQSLESQLLAYQSKKTSRRNLVENDSKFSNLQKEYGQLLELYEMQSKNLKSVPKQLQTMSKDGSNETKAIHGFEAELESRSKIGETLDSKHAQLLDLQNANHQLQQDNSSARNTQDSQRVSLEHLEAQALVDQFEISELKSKICLLEAEYKANHQISTSYTHEEEISSSGLVPYRSDAARQSIPNDLLIIGANQLWMFTPAGIIQDIRCGIFKIDDEISIYHIKSRDYHHLHLAYALIVLTMIVISLPLCYYLVQGYPPSLTWKLSTQWFGIVIAILILRRPR